MKKQALTIIFLLSSLFSFSQEALNYTDENGLKQGIWRVDMEKGDEISYCLYTYVNNIKEGEFKAFYNNGILAVEGTFSKDCINGRHRTYYRSGEIKAKTIFKNGYKEGKYFHLFKNGKTSIIEEYKRDTLVSQITSIINMLVSTYKHYVILSIFTNQT